MINDVDTNVVYLSSWLKSDYPAFYNELAGLLQSNGIACHLLEGTNDIWARDYMPIQIYEDYFVQYVYNPNYLQKCRQYITDTTPICKELGIECHTTDLVIDGGNVVKAGKYVIMTEKVYKENKQYTKEEIDEKLRALFCCDLIMLPWDRTEKYGHADGIVKAMNDDTVLMTNYSDFDADMAASFEQILSRYFSVEKLHYTVTEKHKNSWAYINFLRVGNVIILPALGIPEDKQALEQIEQYYSECKVLQLDASEIVKEGGALNCITWNIRQDIQVAEAKA
ncbi:MAG: agmatine deiminase family protein [Prevotellaceae bacterium]|nr:agmatine deiminase family protein [Prevotellaceae bacterium]